MSIDKESKNGGKVVDVVVVGAGFAGLYMLHHLEVKGFSVQGFERASDVGGVWYWNRYPGCRCDFESPFYSYSFDEGLQQEWNWTERYASQEEVLRYLSHVADRFSLRRLIAFNTSVNASEWIEEEQQWRVHIDNGEVFKARFVVLATGAQSAPKYPDIAGIEDFNGEVLFTANWPKHDVQFAGKRVAVIGTGSSGVQVIPPIAQAAAHLTVYQRTAAYVVPMQNRPLSQQYIDEAKRNHRAIRQSMRESFSGAWPLPSTGRPASATPEDERAVHYEKAWEFGGASFQITFTDIFTNKDANHSASEFVRKKIREIMKDPVVAETLSPRSYSLGGKRTVVSTDFYGTFNRDNVDLRDLRKAPLVRIVSNGVETADGVTEFDVVVLAIGFDLLTGSFTRIEIKGSTGQSLAEKWSGEPRTYLGLMSHGFPNLFFITGPNTPSGLSHVVVSIEQHVEWIGECLDTMRSERLKRIEAALEAEDAWVGKCDALAAGSIWVSTDNPYIGANVVGKARKVLLFVGGVAAYEKICKDVVARGYDGFLRSK